MSATIRFNVAAGKMPHLFRDDRAAIRDDMRQVRVPVKAASYSARTQWLAVSPADARTLAAELVAAADRAEHPHTEPCGYDCPRFDARNPSNA